MRGKKILEENNGKMYSLLRKKGTDNVKAKMKYSTKYQNIEDDQNVITQINQNEQVTMM